MTTIKSLAMDQIHAWKEKGGKVRLAITQHSDGKQWFNIPVADVSRVCEDEGECRVFFNFAIDTSDSLPKRPFARAECRLEISLENASLTLQDDSRTSVTVSRGDFSCVLTELRATGFAEN
jgi:hypothetical protein